MTQETKRQIDEMKYEDMLCLWRFAPIGHPMFQGETGNYFSESMKLKRSNISDMEHTEISKRIGWNN